MNSIYTIAVGSADQNGRQAHYDEDCSAKMAVTFSYNSNTSTPPDKKTKQLASSNNLLQTIFTLRVPILYELSMHAMQSHDHVMERDAFTFYVQLTTSLNGHCSDSFTGTSASAPLLSGVIALTLEAK